MESACFQVQVIEVQLHQFRAADAGIEKDEEDSAIPDPYLAIGVAGGQECRDFLYGERPNDFLREANVAERAEGVVMEKVGIHQPVEEAADFSEVAVSGLQGVLGEASQVGIDVGWSDMADIFGKSSSLAILAKRLRVSV